MADAPVQNSFAEKILLAVGLTFNLGLIFTTNTMISLWTI